LCSRSRLGEAIWIYGACRDRDAALLPTVASKLLQAASFAALVLAVADEVYAIEPEPWGGGPASPHVRRHQPVSAVAQ